MEEKGIERLYRSREILKGEKVRIPSGTNGYHTLSLKLDKRGGKLQAVICSVSVNQPPKRTDLDIRFYAMDDENYHRWLTNSPHTALVIAPRVISTSIIFSVQESGTYHIILDNTYSSLTAKEVSIDIYEVWTKEREILEHVTEVEEEAVQEDTEPRIIEKKRLRDKIFSWFRKLKQQKILLAIFLFIVCQLISSSAFIGVVAVIGILLDIDHNEVMNHIGDSFIIFALGGLTLFALFYKATTGEPIPSVAAPSLQP